MGSGSIAAAATAVTTASPPSSFTLSSSPINANAVMTPNNAATRGQAVNVTGAIVIDLEVGESRSMTLPLAGSIQMGAPALIACDGGYLRRDRMWRGAGLAVPVFSIRWGDIHTFLVASKGHSPTSLRLLLPDSLIHSHSLSLDTFFIINHRTRSSVGVGEFLDIIPVVDFAEKCGMHLLQILPINDTSVYGTWWDSYPYSSISTYALHPLYLSLSALREEMPVEIKVEIDTAQSSLQSPSVLYEGSYSHSHRNHLLPVILHFLQHLCLPSLSISIPLSISPPLFFSHSAISLSGSFLILTDS